MGWLPATLAAGFCGMNFLAGLPDGAPLLSKAALVQFFGWSALAYFFAWLCLLWTSGGERKAQPEELQLKAQVGKITFTLFVAYVAFAGWRLL